MGLSLLQKTEFWINGIALNGADLSDMAAAVAAVLSLQEREVQVVDVHPTHIVFDVLAANLPNESIPGKEAAIKDALSALPGVSLLEDIRVRSNSNFGLICAETEGAARTEEWRADMTAELLSKSAKRAIVFPAGIGMKRGGRIENISTPYLKQQLEAHGYAVKIGKPIANSPTDVYTKLEDAISQGYSLILTTDAAGGENKNHMVESILWLDSEAAVPRLSPPRNSTEGRAYFGVGRVGPSLMVCLPGSYGDIEKAAPVLLRGLEEGWSKRLLADRLTEALLKKQSQHDERIMTT